MYRSSRSNSDEARRVNWSALRADFPILDQQVHGQPLIYFDNAATTQKPRAVIEALRHYYEHDNANVHRGIHELSNRATAAFEAARARAAQFINARSADEIIFTRGTTEGINLVAQAWGSKHLKAGDAILLTEMEHHSNIVPWQLLAERTGAQTRLPAGHRRHRPARPEPPRRVPDPAGEAVRDDPHLQLAGHDQSRGRAVRPRAQARRDHAGGCRAKRRAPADGRAGDRLRFPRLLRPQDVRADRHRRAVWPPGSARQPCRRIRAAAR